MRSLTFVKKCHRCVLKSIMGLLLISTHFFLSEVRSWILWVPGKKRYAPTNVGHQVQNSRQQKNIRLLWILIAYSKWVAFIECFGIEHEILHISLVRFGVWSLKRWNATFWDVQTFDKKPQNQLHLWVPAVIVTYNSLVCRLISTTAWVQYFDKYRGMKCRYPHAPIRVPNWKELLY